MEEFHELLCLSLQNSHLCPDLILFLSVLLLLLLETLTLLPSLHQQQQLLLLLVTVSAAVSTIRELNKGRDILWTTTGSAVKTKVMLTMTDSHQK